MPAMKDPVRLGIDLDGVVIDHRAHKLRLARERGYDLEPWQANTNLMGRYLPREAYAAIQRELYGPLTLQAPSVPGAVEGLAALSGEPYIVTAREAASRVIVRQWLDQHGVEESVPPGRVIFCADGEEKGSHCLRLGLGVFLEDKLSYLRRTPKTALRVLLDEDAVADLLDVEPDIVVVRSWPEFVALVREHASPHA